MNYSQEIKDLINVCDYATVAEKFIQLAQAEFEINYLYKALVSMLLSQHYQPASELAHKLDTSSANHKTEIEVLILASYALAGDYEAIQNRPIHHEVQNGYLKAINEWIKSPDNDFRKILLQVDCFRASVAESKAIPNHGWISNYIDCKQCDYSFPIVCSQSNLGLYLTPCLECYSPIIVSRNSLNEHLSERDRDALEKAIKVKSIFSKSKHSTLTQEVSTLTDQQAKCDDNSNSVKDRSKLNVIQLKV
ncbi:MAG: hypothetical protein H6619_01595 [Deltaproteobacteria bacterium]|nr:hypothetical protein [Deltaproteobacteria bacterium]